MKRICIFAHYDKDNIVDDYVLYYIEKLLDVVDNLVFVSDCNLDEIQKDKLKKYTDKIYAKKHGRYDFGSYQIGFASIKEVSNNYDELVFCNDSCYGPLFDLKIIFEKMSSGKNDFWGLTLNNEGVVTDEKTPHVQSFFMVFKKQIFQKDSFIGFFESIQKEENKEDIIYKYEIGITKLLIQKGFEYSTYIKPDENTNNLTIYKWQEIIKEGFPLIKINILKNPIRKVDVLNWQGIVKTHSSYPVELIERHLKRVRNLKSYTQLYKSFEYGFIKKLSQTFKRG